MAELTIQVPDALAQRLKPLQDSLPHLLTRLAESLPSHLEGERKGTRPPVAQPTEASRVYAEVLDVLLTRPTPQDILAFKVSEAAQTRLRVLLDKNREEGLDETETAELDLYEQLEQLMILLKARAFNADEE